MGNDAPYTCTATHPRIIYDYFRQLFAQVTGTLIDPLRENTAMSPERYVGPEDNLLEMLPEQCHSICLPSPILTIEETNALKNL